MILFAWTAIVPVIACLAITILLGCGMLASILTSGRTRVTIQVVLALVGLALAILLF
jgi:hypothetical protein